MQQIRCRQLTDDALPQMLMDTVPLIRLILIDGFTGCSKIPEKVLAWRFVQLIGSRAKTTTIMMKISEL